MAWIKTSDTCICVFGTLLQLKQIDLHTRFDRAGSLKMRELQFYDTAAAIHDLHLHALSMAHKIDGMLINSFGGTYKFSCDSEKAVRAMLPRLYDADTTLEELADGLDKSYALT
jgi:hypothetical protein